MSDVLKIESYKINFGKEKTISYPDIRVKKGEYFGICSQSGYGKTSFLDSLFSYRFQGDIEYKVAELFEKDLKAWHKEKYCKSLYKKISYLPQFAQDALNPKMTIGKTLRLVLKGTKADKEEIEYILKKLSLSKELLDRYPQDRKSVV